MQCCSRGTRSLRITQPGVENNASSSVRALLAVQHAPCSDDRRYAEYCGRHPTAGQINSSGFIGQGSCSCFSSGHERACHGQMRSTHDVSPQLLAILLWTCGWCCPVAVNPRLPPIKSWPASRETICQVPSTPPGHAVCLAGRVEMGAKIGDDGPQTNPSRTCRRTNPTADFAFQIRFQSISIFCRSPADPTLAGGLILALTYL